MHVLDYLENTLVESDAFYSSGMVGKNTERIVLFFKSSVGMVSSEQVADDFLRFFLRLDLEGAKVRHWSGQVWRRCIVVEI